MLKNNSLRRSLAVICSLLFASGNVAFSQIQTTDVNPSANRPYFYQVVDSNNISAASATIPGSRMNVKMGKVTSRASVIAMETLKGRDMCKPDKEGISDFTIWALSADRGSRVTVNPGRKQAALLVIGTMIKYVPAGDYCKTQRLRAEKTDRGAFAIGYPTSFHPYPRTFMAVPSGASDDMSVSAFCNKYRQNLGQFYNAMSANAQIMRGFEPSFVSVLGRNETMSNGFAGTQKSPSFAPAGTKGKDVTVVYPGLGHKRELIAEVNNSSDPVRVLDNRYANSAKPSDDAQAAALMAAAQTDYFLTPTNSRVEAHLQIISTFLQTLGVYENWQQLMNQNLLQVNNQYTSVDADYISHLVVNACGKVPEPEMIYRAYMIGPDINAKLRGMSPAPNAPMATASSFEAKNIPPEYQRMIDQYQAQIKSTRNINIKEANLYGQARTNAESIPHVPRIYVHYKVEMLDKGVDLTNEVKQGALVLKPSPLDRR